MKYICLGYIEPSKFETMSENGRNTMVDECWTYDDELRKSGHFAGGEALQGPNTAATLRWNNGKVSVTDGPYAETKEQLGGILILEARDMDHAIELMSKHPGVKAGLSRSVRLGTCPKWFAKESCGERSHESHDSKFKHIEDYEK